MNNKNCNDEKPDFIKNLDSNESPCNKYKKYESSEEKNSTKYDEK